jgi:hypothetical protein
MRKMLSITSGVLLMLFAVVYQLRTNADVRLLGDPILQVKNGRISQYPDLTIGQAFTTAFDSHRWWSGESERLVTFVDLRGRFKADAIFKSKAGYQACVARITAAGGNLGASKTCGPDELLTVQFDFIIPPDGSAIRVSYIDMAPWRRLGLLDEKAVLKYVFERP